MKNKKEKRTKIKCIIDFFKYIIFIIKLMFWTSIIILSSGVASWFLPDDIDEYKDDWELMGEWQEKQRIINKKIKYK